MGIFNFGKKKNNNTPACACQCGCPTEEIDIKDISDLEGVTKDNVSIKVLGAGCTSCHILVENTQKAIQNMGLSIDVEYVTDMEKIVQYGVMSVPALVVNEKVISMGKVLKPSEVEKMLNKLGL